MPAILMKDTMQRRPSSRRRRSSNNNNAMSNATPISTNTSSWASIHNSQGCLPLPSLLWLSRNCSSAALLSTSTIITAPQSNCRSQATSLSRWQDALTTATSPPMEDSWGHFIEIAP